MTLSAVERQVLELFAAGDHPALEILRAQLAGATIASRQYSGVGAFVDLALATDCPRIPVVRWVISDVHLTHPQLKHDGGAVLFVEEGLAKMLEMFSFDEPWPELDTGLRATYLRRTWQPPNRGGEVKPSDTRDMEWLVESFNDAKRSSGAA